jgi:hypothetical protein
MKPHRYDPDRYIPAARRACNGYVPAIVAQALDRADAEWHRIARITDSGDLAHAVRAERLAVICTRRAAWWDVLARWTYHRTLHGHDMPPVFGTAAHAARSRELSDARFWSEIAADWRARAERRPTSDAAGALSNWDELGVTA